MSRTPQPPLPATKQLAPALDTRLRTDTPASPPRTLANRFVSALTSILTLCKREPLLAFNFVTLGVFWLLVFWRLHTEWTVNELYAYGWAVPFLALYLFAERWRDRPAIATKSRPPAIWLVIPAALLLAYVPIRLINEANPDWVKINFTMTSLVVAFSFCALFSTGRLHYVWHFAFPLLFVYTALPWPVMVEENLVQTLTHWNTHASAELLTVGGLPSIAVGNIIQAGSSWVNVAEACSGIRSLQTAFMMSLFLGEFYRLGWLSRAMLMLSSFAAAFALNIARTITLTIINANAGATTMESWHDTIGIAVMLLCLASLWLLAHGFFKFKIKYGDHTLLGALTIGKQRTGRKNQTAENTSPASAPTNRGRFATAPFPAFFIIFAIAVLLFAETGTQTWYGYHETHLTSPPSWEINWPRNNPNFSETTFPDRTRAILKYNDAQSAAWTMPGGYAVQMYCIRWLPGRVSKFLAGAHYPTVCLPATGLKFQEEAGVFDYAAGPVTIHFTAYLFEDRARPVYVFHAIVEDRPPLDGETIDYRQVSSTDRIDSVLRGHRNLGQHVLGISIHNTATLDEAQAILTKTLAQTLRITAAPTVTSNSRANMQNKM